TSQSSAPPLHDALPIFRHHSERAYRATREAIALVIVHFVESLGGIQAVQSFRREPRNQEIFDDLDGRYHDANVWSARLAATYGRSEEHTSELQSRENLV